MSQKDIQQDGFCYLAPTELFKNQKLYVKKSHSLGQSQLAYHRAWGLCENSDSLNVFCFFVFFQMKF